ncbi:iron chaperone [Demequina sp. NBRC 110054]|uniref:iron chaperone n=1 Tax=Demequina sp. NBRC 110054 TaxID=1570343 RepID=UPI0013565E71|nr:DUF1801 domain-containing protein [Demequina sp. NBRC 110054]
MTAAEVDAYLAGYEGAHLATMTALREMLAELLPDADQGLSYGAPAFRVRGKLAAGFSAAKKHVTFFPHSGTVLEAMDPAVLEGFTWSKGAVQIPLDAAPPRDLIAAVVSARLEQIS